MSTVDCTHHAFARGETAGGRKLSLVAAGVGILLLGGLGVVALGIGLVPGHLLSPPLTYLLGGLFSIPFVYSAAMVVIALVRWRAPSPETRVGPVLGLLAAMEFRDPHTFQHSQKVAAHVVAIAEQMGLDKEAAARVRDSALLCDLGMSFLPDAILAHHGRLDDTQKAMVMTHPLVSYEVLQKCGAPDHLALAAKYHHERYGGTGYPNGLSGSEIPIEAQIIAVADTYVAVTSERPYREALSPEAAVQELQIGRGMLFNPMIVEAFLKTRNSPQPANESAPAQGSLHHIVAEPSPWTLGMLTSTQHKASTILFRLGQETKSIIDLPVLLGRVLSLLEEVLGYSHCAILLNQDEAGNLALRAAIGGRRHQEGMTIARREGLIGWVARYGAIRLVPNVASDPNYAADSYFGAGAMLVAPLTTEARATGVLIIESESTDALTLDDARIVEAIGPHIAAMIEVARLHQQATEAASRDGLTSLYNQRYFYERLDEELARSKRHTLDLSIAIIDIDNLKQVNDTYGHLAGDQTLKRVAHVLQTALRSSDVVARYGGDEFAIIMPQTESEEAEKVMARVMLSIDAERLAQDGTAFPMPTRCCGIAAYPQDGDQPTRLFVVADTRLYLAKRSKKNLSHSPAPAIIETSRPHSYPTI